MDYRLLGNSGLKVPSLCFGTATFGGGNEFFKAWGNSGVDEATRIVGLCMDAGVNFFDTADIYSDGLAESILGKAIAGKRARRSDFHQSHLPAGLGAERRRLFPPSPHRCLRGQPQAARHGLYRRLPPAWLRRSDPARRSALDPRRSGSRRQGPLHRLLELLRLASDEIAIHFGTLWLDEICRRIRSTIRSSAGITNGN